MDRLIEQQQPGDPNAPIHRCSVRSLHVADPAEAAAILKLAQQAQREYPDAHDARLNLALAYYRAGYYEVAQRCAYDSLAAAAPWQEHAVAWPVLAMCHWQLGDHDEARRFLRKAAWWVDFTRRAATHPGSAGPSSIDDCEWLRTHALYQEAQSLISAGPPISSPNEPPDAATR
jgi:tetratricopeptide (TPR) repeat protein